MKTQRYYGWTDHFRLIAALLVIAIHDAAVGEMRAYKIYIFLL